MRTLSKILLPVLLIAASLAGASYLRATKPDVMPSEEVEAVWAVRAALIEHRDHRPVLDLFGELVPGREVILRSKVPGEVIEASPKLREGGRFEKGEVLLRIDPFDYQAAIDDILAQIAEAEARRAELLANRATEELMLDLDREQLELVQRDVQRFERLAQSPAASEKSLDDAMIASSRQTATVGQREQSLLVLDARLAQQDAAIERLAVAKRRAERDLADTVFKAPFDGVIADAGAELGQTLNGSDVIGRLIDDQQLEISFQLASSEFGRLWQNGLIGRKIRGRWALGDIAFILPATIARVIPAIDPASGGVTVFATIDDQHRDIPLRPGAFIEVEMEDRLYQDVVELPASALFGRNKVYVIEDDRLRETVVDLVAMRGDRVLITTDIAEGAKVVVSRLAEIGPDLKVEIVE